LFLTSNPMPPPRQSKRREKSNVTRLCKAQDMYAGEEESASCQDRTECVTVCQGAVDLLRVPDRTKGSEPSARPQLPTRWAPRAAMLNGQSLLWLGSWTQCPGCPTNGRSEGDISVETKRGITLNATPSDYSHASPNRRATPEAPQQLSLTGAVWQCFDGPVN
jgi:hypothetical protein